VYETTLHCKAFTGEPARLNRIAVDGDGVVLVYDDVAGYFTSCHRLNSMIVARVRKQARIAAMA
jgi:hypothetical protein